MPRLLNKAEILCGWCLMPFVVWVGLFLSASSAFCAQDLTASTISSALNNFDEAFEDLQRERKALKEEVEDLKRDRQIVRDTFDRRVEEIENQKLTLVEALENAQSRAQQIEEEKLSLLEQIEDLKLKLNKHDDVVNIKDTTLTDAKKEIERLNEHVARLEQAFEKSAQRLQRVQEEKESLERELEIMKDERKNILFNYEDDFEKTKREKKDLEKKLVSFQKDTGKREDKTALENRREENLRDKHKKEMLKAVEAQGLLKKEINELTRKQADLITGHKEEMAAAARASQDNLKEMECLKKKDEKLRRELDQAGQKILDYRQQIEGLRKQNLDLAKHGNDEEPFLEKTLQQAKEEKQAYEKQIKDLKDRLEGVQEKLDASQRRLELMANKARELAGKVS